jgi:hypothetical protein
MKAYTLKEINEIKQEIRTGKPISLIAYDLSKQWNRPIAGMYTKVWKLSKSTKKIKSNYNGPIRKPYKPRVQLRPSMAVPLPLDWNLDKKEEIVLKDICEEIINKEEFVDDNVQEPAEIGIEVPVSSIAFTGVPSRVVIYPDHIRYYYNN